MLSTIEIQGPATFATGTTLTTDKKINLIYGLNGTGKSTICRFLKSPDAEEFSKCRIAPTTSSSIYVYNGDFVQENFYESETLKGIFSLSKENKDAELRIAAAKEKRSEFDKHRVGHSAKIEELTAAISRCRQLTEESTWEIKTNYTGGDRVLEYCLEGLKGKKEALLNHLIAVAKPPERPTYDTHQLRAEAQALTGDAQPCANLLSIDTGATPIEEDAVFETPIIGSQHSAVSRLINKLGNSDWVRQGLSYAEDPKSSPTPCPFCQEGTISPELLDQIRSFFDDSYQDAVNLVEDHLTKYEAHLKRIPRLEDVKNHPFASDKLLLLIEQLRALLNGNLSRIRNKSMNPSAEEILSDSSTLIAELNTEIADINQRISTHNEKLRDKTQALANIKSRFWSLMRWEYDHIIARYKQEQAELGSALTVARAELATAQDSIAGMDREIAKIQKETINIDEAVENINHALLDLGIDDFAIRKYDDNLYSLHRKGGRGSGKFSTLSEGEKMIITLLYFCELCKGRRSATDTTDEKIIVFDDPISSLSHIYVFSIGQLIRSTFFKNNLAKQIFVFTHSLYFFYELADPRHDRREKDQALFRITKSQGESKVSEMKYDEIQNDYQAYWQIVNDRGQHPALIANCMRNIIDYFFSFVAKLDFNNVFQQDPLRANRFQAFARYMNRESHSFGQNIYDLKEFDYEVFQEGLRLVFEQTSYGEHYRKMSTL
jgi:wobble nucleotide-excising tRNase